MMYGYGVKCKIRNGFIYKFNVICSDIMFRNFWEKWIYLKVLSMLF